MGRRSNETGTGKGEEKREEREGREGRKRGREKGRPTLARVVQTVKSW